METHAGNKRQDFAFRRLAKKTLLALEEADCCYHSIFFLHFERHFAISTHHINAIGY
jgi:hypothetical protein